MSGDLRSEIREREEIEENLPEELQRLRPDIGFEKTKSANTSRTEIL
jgi:hypothetical protein